MHRRWPTQHQFVDDRWDDVKVISRDPLVLQVPTHGNEAKQPDKPKPPQAKESKSPKLSAEWRARFKAAREAKPIMLAGRVVDDTTGKPVDRFILRNGYVDDKNPDKLPWGYTEDRIVSSGGDGQFRKQLQCGANWQTLVVAPGYLPQPIFDKPSPPSTKTIENLVVRLKRGGSVAGRVLNHDGTPAAGATVFLISAESSPWIRDGKAWRWLMESMNDKPKLVEEEMANRTIADAEGRFTLYGIGTGANRHRRLDAARQPLECGAPSKERCRHENHRLLDQAARGRPPASQVRHPRQRRRGTVCPPGRRLAHVAQQPQLLSRLPSAEQGPDHRQQSGPRQVLYSLDNAARSATAAPSRSSPAGRRRPSSSAIAARRSKAKSSVSPPACTPATKAIPARW